MYPTRTPAVPDADWMKIGMDFWMLGAEASWVIWLRSIRLATGGATAQREAMLMMTEKVSASVDLAMQLATVAAPTPHGTATRAIRHYRGRVQANQRRLSR